HVILRFEIEKGLIDGSIRPRDVPEEWHARMTEYLGLPTRDTYKDGPMQDVHWPSGAFGYFPSYTLGAMIAAQLWAAMEKDIPDARAQMRRGHFVAINDWRRDRIWSQASRYSTPDLLVHATGEKLNGRYFEEHLQRRYLA
ncbi:MAG: carboxypeptidase M32, partial [Devosia sp.]